MRRVPVQNLVQIACRLVLGGVFLAAGIPKALDRQATVLAVDSYELLPPGSVQVVATVLPWVEIALGAFLLAGLFVRFSAVAAGALIVAFLFAMARARARGLAIDCGCFGAGGPGEGVGWWDLARDAGLLAMAVGLAWRPRGPLQLDRFVLKEVER